MTIAIYPGSFDPVTNGHVDIARRAASLFDKVIIGVYDTPSKKLLFDTEERVGLFRKAVADIGNIEVQPYKGLTVAYAQKMGAKVLVKGLRASSDFENEFEMALMNRNVAPDIETVCMITRLEFQFLSSSLLKEVYSLGGSVGNLVPPHVETALQVRLPNGREKE